LEKEFVILHGFISTSPVYHTNIFFGSTDILVCESLRGAQEEWHRQKCLRHLLKYSPLRVILTCLFLFTSVLPTHAQTPALPVFQAFIPQLAPVSIGDTLLVPIMLRGLTTSARQRFISTVEFIFRFNPSVAYLLDTSLSKAAYYADNNMAVSIRRSINRRLRAVEDTIIQIPVLVTWGDAETSELKIGADRSDPGYTFQVTDSTGVQTVPVRNGLLQIRDASWGDSLLTINNNASQLRMTISPNPATETITFQLSIGGLPLQPFSTPTLALYYIVGDRAGEDAIDLSPRLAPLFRSRSAETVIVQRRDVINVPRGLYVCRFTYASYAITRLLRLL
jgi:hypothetical protein